MSSAPDASDAALSGANEGGDDADIDSRPPEAEDHDEPEVITVSVNSQNPIGDSPTNDGSASAPKAQAAPRWNFPKCPGKAIWDHFDKIPDDPKFAKCKYCDKKVC